MKVYDFLKSELSKLFLPNELAEQEEKIRKILRIKQLKKRGSNKIKPRIKSKDVIKKYKKNTTYEFRTIDNYDNGYRGIFTHRVTPLKEREELVLDTVKDYEFKTLKPIYKKRDYSPEEQKMIDEFVALNEVQAKSKKF